MNDIISLVGLLVFIFHMYKLRSKGKLDLFNFFLWIFLYLIAINLISFLISPESMWEEAKRGFEAGFQDSQK